MVVYTKLTCRKEVDTFQALEHSLLQKMQLQILDGLGLLSETYTVAVQEACSSTARVTKAAEGVKTLYQCLQQLEIPNCGRTTGNANTRAYIRREVKTLHKLNR